MGSMSVLELTFKADSIWPLWYASGPDVVNLDECKHRRFFLYISQKLICSVFLYTSFRDPFRPGVLWRTSPWGPQRWALTTLYVSHNVAFFRDKIPRIRVLTLFCKLGKLSRTHAHGVLNFQRTIFDKKWKWEYPEKVEIVFSWFVFT